MAYNFVQNDLVRFSNAATAFAGVGLVVGCATTELPVLGRTYIVKVIECESIPSDDYPFDTITVPESSMTLI